MKTNLPSISIDKLSKYIREEVTASMEAILDDPIGWTNDADMTVEEYFAAWQFLTSVFGENTEVEIDLEEIFKDIINTWAPWSEEQVEVREELTALFQIEEES